MGRCLRKEGHNSDRYEHVTRTQMKLQMLLREIRGPGRKRDGEGLASPFSLCRVPFDIDLKPSLLGSGSQLLLGLLKNRYFPKPHTVSEWGAHSLPMS